MHKRKQGKKVMSIVLGGIDPVTGDQVEQLAAIRSSSKAVSFG